VLEVTAWAGDLDTSPPPATEVVAATRRRARQVVAAARPADAVDATLAYAADAFVIDTPNGPDVLAGYPWFGTWSRDTMISYEGLFLPTGRAEEGRRLLRAYAATLSEGMLANTADTGRTEYNTVDATLWFLHAVERHVTLTGDTDLAAELLPALRGIVEAHLASTRYGIKVDPADGLITQGADGEALTWMDARVHGVPVTPRRGKPVEVNALWVNGLAGLVALCKRTRTRPRGLKALATTARDSFRRRYPARDVGWLYDVLDGSSGAGGNAGDDASLRPNQLFAWSLPYAPLKPDRQALQRIDAALLTPLGLRTLTPDAPGYTPLHRGSPALRDGAYHQGTVWPWLLGAHAAATVRDGREISGLFFGIESHLPEFGLGSVSETADGQPPHAATGCPFQAWSVSEVLRARRF
jgi:predicted glycogen debranching enzyme